MNPFSEKTATPDLEKLRRFALAIGLILFTYTAALVELDTGETIHPLGLPLKVNSPEWLGIGLAIASAWGALRFTYYGVWKTEPPWRKKWPVLKKLRGVKPNFKNASHVEQWVDGFRALFPRLPGLRITAHTEPYFPNLSQEQETKVVERVSIPWPFYLAAFYEDFDYAAPITLNVFALGYWIWRVWSS